MMKTNLVTRVATRYLQSGVFRLPPKLLNDIKNWVLETVSKYYQVEASLFQNKSAFFAPLLQQIDTVNRVLDKFAWEMDAKDAHTMIPKLKLEVRKLEQAAQKYHVRMVDLPSETNYQFIQSEEFQELPKRKQEKHTSRIEDIIHRSIRHLETLLEIKGKDDNTDHEKNMRFLKGIYNGSNPSVALDAGIVNSFPVEDYPKPLLVVIREDERSHAFFNASKFQITLLILPYRYVKSSLPTVFRKLKDNIEHELVHAMQTVLQNKHKSESAGKPSRKPFEVTQHSELEQIRDKFKDQTISTYDLHDIDDVEFYAMLHSEIIHFKRQYPQGGGNTEIRNWISQSAFFKTLKKFPSQQFKFKKAVKLFYQEVSTQKTATLHKDVQEKTMDNRQLIRQAYIKFAGPTTGGYPKEFWSWVKGRKFPNPDYDSRKPGSKKEISFGTLHKKDKDKAGEVYAEWSHKLMGDLRYDKKPTEDEQNITQKYIQDHADIKNKQNLRNIKKILPKYEKELDTYSDSFSKADFAEFKKHMLQPEVVLQNSKDFLGGSLSPNIEIPEKYLKKMQLNLRMPPEEAYSSELPKPPKSQKQDQNADLSDLGIPHKKKDKKMKKASLRSQMIKLAYENPELREDLLPLLKEASE